MPRTRNKTDYSDLNYTKRIDHEAGHIPRQRIAEPAVCKTCNSVYSAGRWSPGSGVDNSIVGEEAKVVCPACVQVKTGTPLGFVYLKGSFQEIHAEEIQNLVRNEEKKINKNNPLARIMEIESSGDGITIATTTPHFAQHIGRALHRAYGGDIKYDLVSGEKLARVYWQRD